MEGLFYIYIFVEKCINWNTVNGLKNYILSLFQEDSIRMTSFFFFQILSDLPNLPFLYIYHHHVSMDFCDSLSISLSLSLLSLSSSVPIIPIPPILCLHRPDINKFLLLLQQCLTCLVHLTWMVSEMGGKLPCRGP